QKLVKSIKPGVSRTPTNEIMIVNPTIRELISRAEDKKIPDAIRIGYLEGMVDFNENLRQLVERGDIDRAVALEYSPNPDRLKMPIAMDHCPPRPDRNPVSSVMLLRLAGCGENRLPRF